MARTILTVVLVVLLNVLVGCNGVDSGKGQLVPAGAIQSARPVRAASEADIIEQTVINRRAYRQGLESLVKRYADTGDNMKLGWAQKELAALDSMPKYNYIIEAGVAGPNLKAVNSIPEANYLYKEAVDLENKAKELLVIKNKDLLRVVLGKYNQLIRKHPSSDKIDDAAYRAARIYEGFRDYTISLVYYQRVYQWNPETSYPARFKAAYILDRRLHRRAEAVELYQQALKSDKLSGNYRDFARTRIQKFTSENEQ